MLSNPPYGKSWKSDLERMGGKKGVKDPRFVIEHAGDPEYSLLTRSSDGQMLFLANMLSKMKHETTLGSRIAEVHNGSSALHGRRRPGREQHPSLDHRERLARGHRRAAAEHLLQHRHRDLHLGAEQPQARAPARQGPAHRRDASGSSRCARTSARRTANWATTTSCGSATPSWRSRRPSSRRSSRTKRSGTGRSPSSDRFASTASTLSAPTRRRRSRRCKEDGRVGTTAQPVIRKIHKTGIEPTRSTGASRRRSTAGTRSSSTSQTPTCATPSRCRCWRKAASRRSSDREVLAARRERLVRRRSVKIGYEISFTRHFYKPSALRTLSEIRADILALETRD